MPGLYRKKVDLDSYTLPTPQISKDEPSTESDSDWAAEDLDSVKIDMKDRRKASGQEIADMKLRSKMFGSASLKASKVQETRPFLDQFPYKSCQRGLSGRRKRQATLEKRKKAPIMSLQDPEAQVSEEETFDLQDILTPSAENLVKRRSALVPSKKTDEEMRYVASKYAMAALATVKLKKVHPTTR